MKLRTAVAGAIAVGLTAIAIRAALAASFDAGELPTVRPSVRAEQEAGRLVVDLTVSDVQGLGSFTAVVLFPGRVLQVDGAASVTAGEFLTQAGSHFCFEPTIEEAALRIACTVEGAEGLSGSGPLATISFSAVADGGGRISVSRVQLETPAGEPIPFQTVDASFAATSAGEGGGRNTTLMVIVAVIGALVVGSVLAFTISQRRR